MNKFARFLALLLATLLISTAMLACHKQQDAAPDATDAPAAPDATAIPDSFFVGTWTGVSYLLDGSDVTQAMESNQSTSTIALGADYNAYIETAGSGVAATWARTEDGLSLTHAEEVTAIRLTEDGQLEWTMQDEDNATSSVLVILYNKTADTAELPSETTDGAVNIPVDPDVDVLNPIGSWTLYYAETQGVDVTEGLLAQMSLIVVFNVDGTVQMTGGGFDEEQITWTLDGTTITINDGTADDVMQLADGRLDWNLVVGEDSILLRFIKTTNRTDG